VQKILVLPDGSATAEAAFRVFFTAAWPPVFFIRLTVPCD
jgi:hypothetical protein